MRLRFSALTLACCVTLLPGLGRANPGDAAAAHVDALGRRYAAQPLPRLPARASATRILERAAERASRTGATVRDGTLEARDSSWRLHVSEPYGDGFLGLALDAKAGQAGYHKIALGPVRQGIAIQRSNLTPYGLNGRVLTRTFYPLEGGQALEQAELSTRQTTQSALGDSVRVSGAARYYLHDASGVRTPITQAAFRERLATVPDLVRSFDPNLTHRPLQVALPSY